MYCANCGKEIESGKAYCPFCGAAQPREQQAQARPVVATDTEKTAAKPKKPMVVVFSAVAVCIVVAVACLFLLGGRGYKNIPKKRTAAIDACNPQAVVNLFPDGLWEKACDSQGYTYSEGLAELRSVYENEKEQRDAEYGTWKREVEILGEEDYDADALRRIQEVARECGIDIDAAKALTVEITTVSHGDAVDSDTAFFNVVKVGNSWYLWLG